MKSLRPIAASKLTSAHFTKSPVWRFLNDDREEPAVAPEADLPITDAGGCLVGARFLLADKSHLDGYLANLSLSKPSRNAHLLSVALFIGKKTHHLARYFDVDYDCSGPESLAHC